MAAASPRRFGAVKSGRAHPPDAVYSRKEHCYYQFPLNLDNAVFESLEVTLLIRRRRGLISGQSGPIHSFTVTPFPIEMAVRIASSLCYWCSTSNCRIASINLLNSKRLAHTLDGAYRNESNPFPYPRHRHPTPHQIFHLPYSATEAEIKSRCLPCLLCFEVV